jgi:hypothetical protein
MTADLSRLDAELENIPVDQLAVARGLLAAREWAGRELATVDAALDSLSNGAPVGSAAPSVAEASLGLEGLFDDDPVDVGGDAIAARDDLASSGDIASDLAAALEGDDDELGAESSDDGDDDLMEFDDLEIIEDDDLLTLD